MSLNDFTPSSHVLIKAEHPTPMDSLEKPNLFLQKTHLHEQMGTYQTVQTPIVKNKWMFLYRDLKPRSSCLHLKMGPTKLQYALQG